MKLRKQLGELDEYQELTSARIRHLVEVREPLVLVSQIQRSGGTLLSRLFDGHPECHADPFELKIGYPKKHLWPPLDLAQPDTWFGMLFTSSALERLQPSGRTKRPGEGRSAFPCLFLPRLQKAIFDACVSSRAIESERDVLDCYFTSYFNAWVDNNNLYTGPKKVVTGFTPRLAMDPANVERFFAAYPEGTLISIVRDPGGWYESASKHMPEYYADVEEALALWRRSAEATVAAAERFGSRVLVLTYEQLVAEPEATMRRVAERIGITMSPRLLVPTFNGMAIRANSSEPVAGEGILAERAVAHRGSAEAAVGSRIEELAGDLYAAAARLAR